MIVDVVVVEMELFQRRRLREIAETLDEVLGQMQDFAVGKDERPQLLVDPVGDEDEVDDLEMKEKKKEKKMKEKRKEEKEKKKKGKKMKEEKEKKKAGEEK